MIRTFMFSLVVAGTAMLGVTACSSNDTAAPSTTAGADGTTSDGSGGSGGSGGSDGSGGSTEAGEGLCALVTQDEVADALGQPVAEGVSTDLAGSATCVWLDTTTGGPGVTVMAIPLEEFTGRSTGTQTYGATVEPIAGLGDAAHFTDFGGTNSLEFQLGDAAYSVTVDTGSMTPEQVRSGEQQFAQLLLTRL